MCPGLSAHCFGARCEEEGSSRSFVLLPLLVALTEAVLLDLEGSASVALSDTFCDYPAQVRLDCFFPCVAVRLTHVFAIISFCFVL